MKCSASSSALSMLVILNRVKGLVCNKMRFFTSFRMTREEFRMKGSGSCVILSETKDLFF